MEINKKKFKKDFMRKFATVCAKPLDEASDHDKYVALAMLVREYMSEQWIRTNERYVKNAEKQVYYFSMEFLLGKLLINNLMSLGLKEICEEALDDFGVKLEDVERAERDQGLGNGGLGRLAACFMDSLASLGIPGHGCGIRYKYGLFEQQIENGYQVEIPDNWLSDGNPWEVKKPDKSVGVKFGGYVEIIKQEDGHLKFEHKNYEMIKAIPYDTPVIGHENETINTLRLWSAEAVKEFDYSHFNKGEYMKAFWPKHNTEVISYVLYPNDAHEEGRKLRLKQEYFFVSAGIQSIIRTYRKTGKDLKDLHKHVAIHVNDTHPALAIPELMRIFIDEEEMKWKEAWEITKQVMSYTNHTIMSEALETWHVDMFRELLPRIYMIVEEMNERFCAELRNCSCSFEQISSMAIIWDGRVRMANLAIYGSHSVNGVARLHTEILKHQELKDFYKCFPEKFNNKTNGITHRRFLLKSNPKLAEYITEKIGDHWIHEPERMDEFEKYKDDVEVQNEILRIKKRNKIRMAEYIKKHYDIDINPDSIFDVHAKRLHEYKRQSLNILHIMHLYNRILENPDLDVTPRTFIFSAKAAPGYYTAKQTIKLINTLADKINNDKRIKDKIKVVFLKNYGVSLAEILIPSADVSEQISTTTKEASGTGNMKFMMNGAITIATLDGANVEIHEKVGDDNIVIFGLKDHEVFEYYKNRNYNPHDLFHQDERINKVANQLVNGFLGVPIEEFSVIYDSIMRHAEPYFVLRDFAEYVEAQEKIDELYKNRSKWAEMCIVNIAKSGEFSSDHTIKEYAREIWDVEPVEK